MGKCNSIADIRRAAVFFVFALLVAACGGGGSDNAPPSQPGNVGPARLPFTDYKYQPMGVTMSREVVLTVVWSRDAPMEFFVDGLRAGGASGQRQCCGPAGQYDYYFYWNTATVSDGPHVLLASARESGTLTGQSVPTVVFVENNLTIPLNLTPNEVFPRPTSNAAATGQLSANLGSGAISGDLVVANIVPTDVHIHAGYATTSGTVVLSLMRDGSTNRWVVPGGSTLTAQQNTSNPSQAQLLQDGGLYIDVHSTAYPNGEIRQQLTSSSVITAFNSLSGDQVVPPANTTANGIVAITSNKFGHRPQRIDVRAGGVNNASKAHVYQGTFNPALVSTVFLSPDTMDHWESSGTGLSTVSGFNTGSWYVNVTSPAYPLGEIRGIVPVIALPSQTTLSELQATVFTPRCATCHNGIGSTLPGSMNLSVGNAHAALVKYVSDQQSDLFRVAAYSYPPTNSPVSYLIHKLTGVNSISGAQMPLGGPYLDADTIAKIRGWIDSGAPNN